MSNMISKILARVLTASLSVASVVAYARTTNDTHPKAATTNFEAHLAHDRFVQTRNCLGQVTTSLQSYHARQICERAHGGTCPNASGGQLVRGSSNHAKDGSQACFTSDPELAEERYHSAVSNAAAKGFADAQVCFIQGAFRLNSAAEAEGYRRAAMQYIGGGLARGDWRVVYLMATPMEAAAHGVGAMSSLKIIGKPFTVYRATQLLMLGADTDYRRKLGYLAELPARFLSKAQIANAKAWARKEYHTYFMGSPILHGDPTVCD